MHAPWESGRRSATRRPTPDAAAAPPQAHSAKPTPCCAATTPAFCATRPPMNHSPPTLGLMKRSILPSLSQVRSARVAGTQGSSSRRWMGTMGNSCNGGQPVKVQGGDDVRLCRAPTGWPGSTPVQRCQPATPCATRLHLLDGPAVHSGAEHCMAPGKVGGGRFKRRTGA